MSLKLNSSSVSSEYIDRYKDLPTVIGKTESWACRTVMSNDIITLKLVAALDRCQLIIRNSVFILEATIETIGCKIDNFPLSKSSFMQKIQMEKLREIKKVIKIDFENDVLDVVISRWYGNQNKNYNCCAKVR